MKRWRWDNSQPVIRATKVAWVGRGKSPANSSSRGKKGGVSCMGGLRLVTNLGRVATPRIGLPSREAMPFHTRRILKNLRNLNLGEGQKKSYLPLGFSGLMVMSYFGKVAERSSRAL